VNIVQGIISDIRRQPVEGGTRTKFRLRSADGKETQVETRLDVPYNNGDVVQASGEIDSDLVLTAISIAHVLQASPPAPKPVPWLWVGVGCALLVIGVVVYRMSSGSPPKVTSPAGGTSGGSTLTVTAKACGKSLPNVELTLTGPTGATTSCRTGPQGSCEFPGLAKGTSQVTFGSITESVKLDGSSPKSVQISEPQKCSESPTPVPKPPNPSGGIPSGGAAYGGAPSGGSTLTVDVVNCEKQPMKNVVVEVATTTTPQKRFDSSTNSKGQSIFPGLQPGTYWVADNAEGGQKIQVVMNGTPSQFVAIVNCVRGR